MARATPGRRAASAGGWFTVGGAAGYMLGGPAVAAVARANKIS